MKLRQIEVFHAVYSTGSVTGAAELLNVTQPAVSKVLSHAESQLGYALFDRVKGRLNPTPEAHELFHQVAEVYENLEQLRDLSRNLATGSKKNVRISVTPAFAQEIIPRTLSVFLQDNATVHVAVNTRHYAEVTTALMSRQFDLGIVFERTPNTGLVEKRLGTAEFVILSPVGWISDTSERLSVAAIADMPFIKLNDRGPLGQLLRVQMQELGTSYNTVATVGTYYIAKSLVSHGVGISIVDEITARSNGLNGLEMRYLDPPILFSVNALWSENAPLSTVARRFLGRFEAELNSVLARKNP